MPCFLSFLFYLLSLFPPSSSSAPSLAACVKKKDLKTKVGGKAEEQRERQARGCWEFAEASTVMADSTTVNITAIMMKEWGEGVCGGTAFSPHI